jgi:hypothetical protein
MLALDLFNTKYERQLREGAVDDLEARRIDDLNDRMQDLLSRAKEPAYQANPKALAALKKQFQQVKDERDSYYKVRNETMEVGLPTPPPSHPTISRAVRPRSADFNLDNLTGQQISDLNRSIASQSDAQLAGHAARTGLHPRIKSAVDAEIARRAQNADAGMDEAGIPGNIPVEKIPGKEDLLKGRGRTYYEDEVNEDDVEDFIKAGGKITYGKPQKGPRRPGMSLASRHIGGGNDRMKPSRSGRAANTQGKPVVSVEDQKKNSALGEKKLGQLRPTLGTGYDVGRSVKKFRAQRGLDEGQVSDEVDHRGDVDTKAKIEVPGVDLKNDTFKITYNKKPYQVKIQNFSQEGLGRWQIADYDVDIINAKGKNLIDLIDWDNDRQVKMVNTIIAYLDTQQAGDIQLMAWRQAGMANSTAEDLYQEIQDFYKNNKQQIEKATAWLTQNIEDAEERQVFANFVKNPVSRPAKAKYVPKEYLMYVAFSYSREGNTELTPGMNLKPIQLNDPDDEEELHRKVDELLKKVQFKFDAFENKIIELADSYGLGSDPDLGSGFGQREMVWDHKTITSSSSESNKNRQQILAKGILKFRADVEKYVAAFNNTLIKIGLPGITEYSTWSGVLGDQLTDQQVRYFETPEGFANLASGKIDVAKMIDDNVEKQGIQEHGGGIGPRQHWQDLMQERKLSVGDPVVVTAPNEFEGKTGEIYDFAPSGKFVIVDLYNHGKHSMHLSDVEYNQYADDQEEDDWYDEGVAEEQKPAGWGEFPPKQEITIVPPKKLKSGETYQDRNKYWQSQGQAPIYKTNEDNEPRAGMAEIYRRLAPKIERYRDSFLAGQLYDELENYAELHGAEREFKQMMNGARNRAHMEYDTNPGGFHNWFWFLPFADEQLEEISRRDFLKGVGATAGLAAMGAPKTANAQEVAKWSNYASKLALNTVMRIHQDSGYDLRNWITQNVSTWVSDYCNNTNSYNAKSVIDYCNDTALESSGLKDLNPLVSAFFTNFKNKVSDFLTAYRAAIMEKTQEFNRVVQQQKQQAIPIAQEDMQKLAAGILLYIYAKEDGNEKLSSSINQILSKIIKAYNNKDQINAIYRGIYERHNETKTQDPAMADRIKKSIVTRANAIVNDLNSVAVRGGGEEFKESVAEGWSDAVVARRTGTPRTPYSVYIKGRKWKDFESDDHAEAVANKLRAKFKAEGRDPSVITVAPTDIAEGLKSTLAGAALAGAMALGGAGAAQAQSASSGLPNATTIIQQIQSGKIQNQNDLSAALGDNQSIRQFVFKQLQAKAGLPGHGADSVINALGGKSTAGAQQPGVQQPTKSAGQSGVIIQRPTDNFEGRIKEDQDTSGVERAILNRIMVAHTDLLMKFGPDKVMQAAEEVAYNVGDVDEIGTSDVSAYVAQVKQILGATP